MCIRDSGELVLDMARGLFAVLLAVVGKQFVVPVFDARPPRRERNQQRLVDSGNLANGLATGGRFTLLELNSKTFPKNVLDRGVVVLRSAHSGLEQHPTIQGPPLTCLLY